MGLQRSKTALVQNILKSARNEVLSLSASRAATNASPGTVGGVPAARPRARHPGDAGRGQTFLQRGVRAGADETLGDRSARRQPSADDADRLVPPLPLHRDRAEAVRRRDASTARPPTRARTGRRSPGALPELQGAINRLEQGNLTLVDPETLDVFFSLEQSSVLGTNLVNGPYAASKMSKLVLSPAQFAERGRLQSGRFRGVLPVARRSESLCRHARLRRSAHDRDHGAPTADRADQQGPVGQSAMGGGGSGEDRRSLPARPRSDDADRFALPDRGSGGVPRDLATIDPHESHRRHRRQARHDDPDRSGETTRRPGRRCGARRA